MSTKTLVIHPDDISTDFLIEIYWDKEWTVMNDPFIDPRDLKEMIKDHDRVVMLGHGSINGLFGGMGMMIDDTFADILKTKETVCIWCNADMYVKRNELKGFFTGMFISEVVEANYHGIEDVDDIDVEISNWIFAESMNRYIFTENVLKKVKIDYWVDNDLISAYNNERLYFNK